MLGRRFPAADCGLRAISAETEMAAPEVEEEVTGDEVDTMVAAVAEEGPLRGGRERTSPH